MKTWVLRMMYIMQGGPDIVFQMRALGQIWRATYTAQEGVIDGRKPFWEIKKKKKRLYSMFKKFKI